MNPSLQKFAISGTRRRSIPEAKLLGRSNSAQPITSSIYARRIHIRLTLRSAHSTHPDRPARQAANLTTEQFNSVYRADPADLEKITAWAKANEPTYSKAARRSGVCRCREAFKISSGLFPWNEASTNIRKTGSIAVAKAKFTSPRSCSESSMGYSVYLHAGWAVRGDGVTLSGGCRRIPLNTALLQTNLRDSFPGSSFPPQVAQLYSYPRTWTAPNRTSRYLLSTCAPSPDRRRRRQHGAYDRLEQVLAEIAGDYERHRQGPDDDLVIIMSRRGGHSMEVMMKLLGHNIAASRSGGMKLVKC